MKKYLNVAYAKIPTIHTLSLDQVPDDLVPVIIKTTENVLL